MIQDGKLRGFAMGQAIPVRTDALGSFLNRVEEHLDADLGVGVACAVRRHYGHRELSLAKPRRPVSAMRLRNLSVPKTQIRTYW
jgi:hypothetical protein